MVPTASIMKIFWTSLVILSLTAAPGFPQETVSETDAQPPGGAPVQAIPGAPEAPAADKAPEPTIPSSFAPSRYESTWEKNPFLLRTVTTTVQKVDWSQDWALAGMFNNNGKVRVSMVNKQTGEYKHLSNEGKQDPEFHLVKANFNRNRTEASADIAKGTEEATIKYDDNLTSKPVTINNTQHPAPGAPGKPGQVQPNKPGAVAPRNGSPVQQPGVAPGMPVNGVGAANPNINTNSGPVPITANPAGNNTPPTISRRRQLIPGTVVPPQQ